VANFTSLERRTFLNRTLPATAASKTIKEACELVFVLLHLGTLI